MSSDIAFVIHVGTTYGFCLMKYMAAERLGIAETIPAYLNPKLKNEDLLKGINFAYGGSGYDPLTAKLVVYVNIYFIVSKYFVKSFL